jgi:tetratricopeptide (TPR) repeat protein
VRAPVSLAVLVVLASSAGPKAPQSDPFRAYQAAVAAYRSGDPADDVPAELAERAGDPASGWAPIDLEAAAMLHTDVCLRLVKAHRQAEASTQLDAASALLRAATARAPDHVEFATRWRDTVSSLLQAFEAKDLGVELDARGKKWWPASKERLAAQAAFAVGLTHEIQAAVAGRLSGPPSTRAILIPAAGVSALRSAQEHYAIALTHDPTYPEPELHLGRIAVVLGRDAAALPHLRVASTATSPQVRYLAFLFLAVVSERAGQLDDAVEQYRRARDAFRWGQSAPLALSHALMREKLDADARAVLSGYFSATRGRAVDPLWMYLADPSTDLGPSLSALRAEIWR